MQGVNLGNWLVLEKWMSPPVRRHGCRGRVLTCAPSSMRRASGSGFKVHRDSYITERDFAYIAGAGLDAMQDPGARASCSTTKATFVCCVDHLDRAFDWAETYGLRDPHRPAHRSRAARTVSTTAGSAGSARGTPTCPGGAGAGRSRTTRRSLPGRPALWGIEVLNEPISAELWDAHRHPEAISRPRPGAGATARSRCRPAF